MTPSSKRPHKVAAALSQSVMTGVLLLGFSASGHCTPDARQSVLLVNNCVQCHADEHTGSPFIGNPEDWREAVAKGEDAMLLNVVQGVGGMPPLGYCSACSEEDLRVLIRAMSGMAGKR